MKKILILIYILLFAGLLYYTVNLFINRNSNENNSNTIQTETEKTITNKNIPVNTTKNSNKNDVEEETSTITTDNSAYVITPQDCSSECNNIKNTKKQVYCNQFCGFSITSQSDSCDELSNLDKDYCLRDQAITKNDLTICEQIIDTGINKQCINRINEDFIDEVMK
jgi:hypothetical protein